MNYFDAIIAIPLVWGLINGFRKGFIVEISSLLALVLGLYGAVRFSFIAGQWINEHYQWSEKAVQLVSFLITFSAIVILVHLMARAVHKLVKLAALGLVNRIAGALFGGLKYLLLVSGLLYLLMSADERYPFLGEETKNNSLLLEPVSEIIPLFFPVIEEVLPEGPQSIIA